MEITQNKLIREPVGPTMHPMETLFMSTSWLVNVYWVVLKMAPWKTHFGYVYFHFFHGNKLFLAMALGICINSKYIGQFMS